MPMLCDVFCEKCSQAGHPTLAHYVLLAEEDALAGPAGEFDREKMGFLQWHRLCVAHHAELSEDEQMAYVPTVYASL